VVNSHIEFRADDAGAVLANSPGCEGIVRFPFLKDNPKGNAPRHYIRNRIDQREQIEGTPISPIAKPARIARTHMPHANTPGTMGSYAAHSETQAHNTLNGRHGRMEESSHELERKA